jgi:hypothetical protein
MTAWSDVAAALEARLDAAEGLLEDGEEADGVEEADLVAPSTVPTAAEQARLEAIGRRSITLQEQLRGELRRLGGELAESGRRRGAARSYRRSPGFGSRPG